MSKIKFNDDWFFTEQPLNESFKLLENPATDYDWQKVDIPHDWLITDVNQLYRDSEGWYRKQYYLEDQANKISLYFDGVYQDSSLYVNNAKVGEWKNGYTAFEFDITDYLQNGSNEIILRVKHQAPNSRWYSGAGIYRSVYLYKRPLMHLSTHGNYCHSKKINENHWQLLVETEASTSENSDKDLIIEHNLFFDDEKVATHSGNFTTKQKSYQAILEVKNPKLWSTSAPNRYLLKTKIISEAGIDEQTNTVGFREFRLDENRGFFLNGEHLKLKGVCLHHDLGALGSVFNKDAQRRLLVLMKEMGVNAIRTAHNPPAEEFLELTDEMGFLVQSEFTDVWQHPKTDYDYARYFSEWSAKDVESWIKRDRNHPSVFMWSIGNEIYDTHGREDGMATAKKLIQSVKQWDKRESAVITFGSNYLLWENTQKVADEIKIVGYNYSEQLYVEHHEKYPNWKIYGSETLSIAASRGVYHFPLNQSILADDDFQCSALGNSSTSWGAKSIEWALTNDRDAEYSMGQFLWTGIDYIGEPTPYHTKSSFLGQVDTAGFPKDSFYVIKSMWQDRKNPVLHIFPYWDFSQNQLIDLRIAANTPQVALYLNQELIEIRSINLDSDENFIQNWQIPYQKGRITVKGLDMAGNVLLEKSVASFTDAIGLKLTASKKQITAKSEELIFVEINALDSENNIVENANNEVQIEVKGAGRLVGIDNGDSTDFSPYKGNCKKLFNGKLLAIVATNGQVGKIEIEATSSRLTSATTTCDAIAGEVEKGLANAYQTVEKRKTTGKIPIRKIELSQKIVTENSNDIRVSAKCFPETAKKQELHWRLTDVKGIDSQIATFTVIDNEVVIQPLANGTVYLRCGVKNGKEHLDFYTSLKFEITGLKDALLNPYQEISGGLYSRSNLELTNGNERGVATLRNETSYVVYDNIDFGSFGSDEIKLQLFPLEGNPFPIEIWQGYPHEQKSQLIDTVYYTKGTIWNTYQEESFKLPKRFQGIQTISFVFKQKVHIRGFQFKKILKAKSELQVIDYDLIYGDSFKKTKDAIENIGNNVTIQFNDMDFSESSSSKLLILGKSLGRSNSIQIKCSNDKKENKTFIEFPQSEEYEWHEFSLPEMTGRQTIEFIFLPGSDFNFKKFKFI